MYTAGWNMPGYLPDMDPEEFDDLTGAILFVMDEINDRANDELDDDIHAKWADMLTLVDNTDEEFSMIGPDGYVYWVIDDGTGTRRGL